MRWDVSFEKTSHDTVFSSEAFGPFGATRSAVESVAHAYDLDNLRPGTGAFVCLFGNRDRMLFLRARPSDGGATIDLWGPGRDVELLTERLESAVLQTMTAWCQGMGPSYKPRMQQVAVPRR